MNPFQPPVADQRSRRFPIRLALRAVGTVLFGVGLVSGLLGLVRPDGIGSGQTLFVAVCFGLSYLALRKRRRARYETS